MPSSSMPLSRRQLLKRTATATTALGACTTTTGASDHLPFEFPTTFESHLPQEYEGPFAAHYQLHFPEKTKLNVAYEQLTKRPDNAPYSSMVIYSDPYPGFRMGQNETQESYACGPAIGTCEQNNVERRDGSVAGFSAYFTVSVEEPGTVLDWTYVSPNFTRAEDIWPVVPNEYPFRFGLDADAPFSVSVEAGTTLYPFDQHTFEDGAAVSTRTGNDTPVPERAASNVNAGIDQQLTAGIAEPKARIGLAANSSFYPAKITGSPGTRRPRAGRFSIDHPGGTESWTLSDTHDYLTFLGDSGPYRLQLTRATVYSDAIFSGFIAGVSPVETLADAID